MSDNKKSRIHVFLYDSPDNKVSRFWAENGMDCHSWHPGRGAKDVETLVVVETGGTVTSHGYDFDDFITVMRMFCEMDASREIAEVVSLHWRADKYLEQAEEELKDFITDETRFVSSKS